MSVFWPSCVAHLYVRFDEAFSVIEPPAPPSTETELTKTPVFGPPAVRPLILEAKQSGSAKGLTGIMNRIPLSCSVDLPSYRTAGTFNMEIEYRDLPIDPRLIRAATVEIYMGAVDPADFATGVTSVERDGSRKSVLHTITAGGGRREDLLLIVGTVDEWHVAHTATGSRISMQGRDLRGLLLDTKIDVRMFKKLDLTKDIVSVVKQVLNAYDWGFKWHVDSFDNDWDDGTGIKKLPSPAAKGNVTAVRQSVSSGGSSTTKPMGGEKLSFWDLITTYCDLVGAVPFFQADKLIIRRSLDYWNQTNMPVGSLQTPFKDGQERKGPDGNGFNIRRLVYGRDVLEYNFTRKFGGVVRPSIQVESLNTDTKELIRVIFPDKQQVAGTGGGVSGGNTAGKKTLSNANKAKVTNVSVSGQNRSDVLRVTKHGIKDKEVLLNIAKALYEEIGRGEIGGSITTKSLTSFGTKDSDPTSANGDPDLLRLRPGDALDLFVDVRELDSQGPSVSTYTDSRRKSPSEQETEIAERLGGTQAAKELARIIVAQANGSILQFQTGFRTGNVHFSWGARAGISIGFDFANYVEARADVVEKNQKARKSPKRKVHTSASSNTSVGSQESAASNADKNRTH